MNIPKEIYERIDQYREEMIRLQEDLTSKIALGSQNGGTGEHEKAECLKDRLAQMNPDHLEEIQAPDPNAAHGYRPNLVAKWNGTKGGPVTWALSHMDIVPPGDITLWDGDPYRIRVEEDRIIGRGVEDNQHGIVSSYFGLKALLDTGNRPERPVGLIFVADEETGSEFGLEYLLKSRADLFRPSDLIVVPDSGNEEGTMIEVAEKSMLWIKFTVLGKQCHGSTPDKGRNSLYGAARLIVALQQVKERFGASDDLFSPPCSTFEPTKMEANVPNVNTIPGRDVFHLDCRILPEYSLDEVLAHMGGIAREISEELGLGIEIEPIYRQPATEPTPRDAPVVKALARAIKSVTGKTAKPMGIGGGTVAAFFRRAKLPAAVWQTESGTPHQPNEFCLISSLLTDAKIFATLYMDPLNEKVRKIRE
ncbi:MAG: M20 family metallo-hydrolase [Desulfobacterales bacterium]|nr:M20 family metallo-hydrolase [Desulfobacterales bacterium]